MDSSTTITGLSHEELTNLQRIHPTENREQEQRRPPARRQKRRGTKGRPSDAPPLPPTYTPDGHVADDALPHRVDVSA